MAIVSPDKTSVKNMDALDPFIGSEDSFSDGLRTLGTAGELLTRVDLDLAYSSEKFLNLDILLMHVVDRAGDLEALIIDNEFVSENSAEKAMEFDILSGILHSEVKELDSFMIALQEDIMDAREKICSYEYMKEAFAEVEGKLQDSEESLRKLQDQVAEMRMQSTKFQSTFVFAGLPSCDGGISEISHISSMHSKTKTHTNDQQRHFLKMLEKSLARELDLEKWLSESRHNEEELKVKLHCVLETMDVILERLFEAECFGEIMTCISKELEGQLDFVQSNLSSALKQEAELNFRLQESMNKLSKNDKELEDFNSRFKKVEAEYNLVSNEAKVERSVLDSKISELESSVENLTANILNMKSRTDNAENKCSLLTAANSKLKEKLNYESSCAVEKVCSLEKQLRLSESRLQHAQASIEASQEQEHMLNSTLSDMKRLIEDLKVKALKAEGRAESEEAKCILLTETNLELNEQTSCLRQRIEWLEISLHQANDVKMGIAKDIGMRTKAISDLVIQLAMERERLHTQISSLQRENNNLVEKLWKARIDTSVVVSHNRNSNTKDSMHHKDDSAIAQCQKSFEESAIESIATSLQVDKSARGGSTCDAEVMPTVLAKEPKSGTVRTDELRQLNLPTLLMTIMVLVISYVVYLFQQERFF